MKKPLKLNKEAIRILTPDHLAKINGGWVSRLITVSCPQPRS